MTFDLDLYLQVNSTLSLKTCPLGNVFSSRSIIFLTWDPIWLNSVGNHEAAGYPQNTGVLVAVRYILFWYCALLTRYLQYIPRNMHTVFALLCFVLVIHWLIFPYQSGLLHWHCGNLTIAPVPAKQPWWIWINTSCEFIMNDCITTTKQSTTKPCAYFLGYTVCVMYHLMTQCLP